MIRLKKNQGLITMMKRALYTILILICYLIGSNIRIPGLVEVESKAITEDGNGFLSNMMGADIYRVDGIYALGLTPWMISMLIVMVWTLITKDKKRSAGDINRLSASLMMIIGVISAVAKTESLKWRFLQPDSKFTYFTCVVVMLTGLMYTLFLSELNEKNGLLGKVVIFLVNICRNVVKSSYALIKIVCAHEKKNLLLILIVILVILLVYVTLYWDRIEFRMKYRQIMVNNEYADNSYYAIRMNPVGIMPIMFAMALYSLYKLIVQGLASLLPIKVTLWLASHAGMNSHFGLGVYLFIIISIIFLMVFQMMDPKEQAEGMLKGGACLENHDPGKPTQRYLTKVILVITTIGGLALIGYIGLFPLMLMDMDMDFGVGMLPVTIMMLGNMFSNQLEEIKMNVRKINYGAFLKDNYEK